MINYIGRSLFIEEKEERVLVIGDMHLGYEKNLRVEGINLGVGVFEEVIEELDRVFKIINKKRGDLKLDKVIFLGDFKDSFSNLAREERNDIVNILDYLGSKVKEIIIIRGNHDNYLLNMIKNGEGRAKIVDYYVWSSYCFLHGDRDFDEIYKPEIRFWIMGHLHPAIVLSEGIKSEKYKCFLEGEFKGKTIIILPSFAEISDGVDVRNIEGNLVWNFNLKNFKVRIVGENLAVLEFGVLKKIKS